MIESLTLGLEGDSDNEINGRGILVHYLIITHLAALLYRMGGLHF